MRGISRAIYSLNEVETISTGQSFMHRLDPRAKITVTVVYIAVVLSYRLHSISGILFMWVFPIILSALSGINYNRVFVKSLYTLPFIMFVGIFNPILDHRPMMRIGSIVVSYGWVDFFSIIVRGLLAVQATLILIMNTGFQKVCYGFRRMGMPSLFAVQLLMVYRYLLLLLQEAASMDNARRSRCYGRRSYSPRMWGCFISQLFVRTLARSERVHRAMLSRGFNGNVVIRGHLRWTLTDTVFTIACVGVFLCVRYVNLSGLFNNVHL